MATPKKTSARNTRTKAAVPAPPALPANGGETTRKIAEQNTSETIARVDGMDLTSICASLNAVRSSIGSEFLKIQGDLEEAYSGYKDVTEATAVQTERLRSLYAIEEKAQQLDAYRAQAAAEQEALTAEIAETREAWEAEEAARDERRAREEAEFQYSLKLARKKEQDEFDATVARRNRDEKIRIEEFERDLKARQAVLAAAEKELADLRTRAAGFDAELQKAKDAGIAQGRNIEKAEARTAATLAQAEFDKNLALKDGLITALTSQRDTLAAQLVAAQESAQKAMDRVAEISQSALTSASQKETMAALQNALASNGGAAKSGR